MIHVPQPAEDHTERDTPVENLPWGALTLRPATAILPHIDAPWAVLWALRIPGN